MIIEKVKDYIENQEEWERRSFYPSEASGCARKLWYKCKLIAKTNRLSKDGFYRMKTGEAIHDFIYKVLKIKEVDVEYEKGFKVDIGLSMPLSGRVDGVANIDGTKYILEIKSTNKYAIRSIKEKGQYKSYLYQVWLYLKYNPWGIENAVVFYYSIDSSDCIEFNMSLKDDPLNKINNDIALETFRLADKNDKPIAKFCSTNFDCQYCEWKDECRNG